MQAYRIETVLQSDGTVTLSHLPFREGEVLDIIVLARSNDTKPSRSYSLRGTNIQYSQPTEPVAQHDWEASSGSILVIVLDTHIWVWWVHGDSQLSQSRQERLQKSESDGLGISVISCWEVAKLVEYGRLVLPVSVEEWIRQALLYPGIELLDLTPRIAVESTQLPAPFHRDPADQIIVATARVHSCPLMTVDDKIVNYPHVQKAV